LTSASNQTTKSTTASVVTTTVVDSGIAVAVAATVAVGVEMVASAIEEFPNVGQLISIVLRMKEAIKTVLATEELFVEFSQDLGLLEKILNCRLAQKREKKKSQAAISPDAENLNHLIDTAEEKLLVSMQEALKLVEEYSKAHAIKRGFFASKYGERIEDCDRNMVKYCSLLSFALTTQLSGGGGTNFSNLGIYQHELKQLRLVSLFIYLLLFFLFIYRVSSVKHL